MMPGKYRAHSSGAKAHVVPALSSQRKLRPPEEGITHIVSTKTRSAYS